MTKSSIIQPSSIDLTLGDQERAAYFHLKEVFLDVALFGGCLREQYIRENTNYNAPTHDIDVKVRNARHGIHPSLEGYLNALPLNQKITLPPFQKDVFSDWIGLGVTKATNRAENWLLETAGDKDRYPIDISLMKTTNDRERVDIALLKSLRVPFSSIAFSDDGFSCHKDFERDAQEMRFSILRNDGLRQVLWEVAYFEKIKAKYPDLKITNPEVPFLLLAKKIKLFLQGRSEGNPSKTLEIARTFAP